MDSDFHHQPHVTVIFAGHSSFVQGSHYSGDQVNGLQTPRTWSGQCNYLFTYLPEYHSALPPISMSTLPMTLSSMDAVPIVCHPNNLIIVWAIGIYIGIRKGIYRTLNRFAVTQTSRRALRPYHVADNLRAETYAVHWKCQWALVCPWWRVSWWQRTASRTFGHCGLYESDGIWYYVTLDYLDCVYYRVFVRLYGQCQCRVQGYLFVPRQRDRLIIYLRYRCISEFRFVCQQTTSVTS